MIKRVGMLASTILFLTSAGVAQAAIGGKAELGVLKTSGNSQSQSINTSIALQHEVGRWENQFTGTIFTAEEDNEQNAERYSSTFKTSFDFTEFNYVFANLSYEKDLFGGVRERTTETVGYGRRLLKSDRNELNVELGAGARQQESQKPESLRESDAIVRGALIYEFEISETSEFTQKLLTESGEENTYTESVTGLKLTIIGPTFAGITYTVKHNSNVPDETKKTDTYLSVSLSYEFGKDD
ncbi:DUF481 domain-containing protein [Abyssibacter sp.]|jgi:putative salt-induced outer membrane protein|uniref:DUF481 domain-containing protein n=1 Tax=Abyssibacter sp. TaxID=2320200 RepID=UPI000C4A7D3E|nr:DUF481 domain-containing protein [Abyssibacter sp.]MBB86979.1 hypothetical protein [Xanthomonadales bacterium]MCK5858416.1 DUF481 domain-containing protein [Abyssibacter sp.]